MSEVRVQQLNEAISEACDENQFRDFLETLDDQNIRDELADGPITQAVKSCQAISSAKRFQSILLHAMVVEAATNRTTPTLIKLCEVQSILLVSFHGLIDKSWKDFEDNTEFVNDSDAFYKLLTDSYLSVARRPEISKNVSLAAIIFAHQIYTNVSKPGKMNDSGREDDIVRLHASLFNGENMNPSLISLSFPLAGLITHERFHTYYVPILNDTFEKLASKTQMLHFIQSFTVLITLLSHSGKEDILGRCIKEDCIVPFLMDASMGLLIDMTSNDVVTTVSHLLSEIVKASPQQGFVVISRALLNALNIDGNVFGGAKECRAFLLRVNKCLGNVARAGQETKNLGNEALTNGEGDEEWRTISSQIVQILLVMDDELVSMALPDWETIHRLSGGEVGQILPLSVTTDEIERKKSDAVATEVESNTDQNSKKLDEETISQATRYPFVSAVVRRGSIEWGANGMQSNIENEAINQLNLNEDESTSSPDLKVQAKLDTDYVDKSVHSEAESSYSSNGEIESDYVEDKASDAENRNLEKFEDEATVQSVLNEAGSISAPNEDTEGEESIKNSVLGEDESNGLSDHDIPVEPKLQDGPFGSSAPLVTAVDTTSLDQKIASKLSGESINHMVARMPSRSLDEKLASKLAGESTTNLAVKSVDENTSLDKRIASKLSDEPSKLKSANAMASENSLELDQKIASKLAHKPINNSSLDKKIASKFSLAHKPVQRPVTGKVVDDDFLQTKIASKLGSPPIVKQGDVKSPNISSLDQRIASKFEQDKNPASSKPTATSLDEKIASKLMQKPLKHPPTRAEEISSASLDQKIASKMGTKPANDDASHMSASDNPFNRKPAEAPMKAATNATMKSTSSNIALDNKLASKLAEASGNLKADVGASKSSIDHKIASKLSFGSSYSQKDGKITKVESNEVLMVDNAVAAASSRTSIRSDLCYSADTSNSRRSILSSDSRIDAKLAGDISISGDSAEGTIDDARKNRSNSLIGTSYISNLSSVSDNDNKSTDHFLRQDVQPNDEDTDDDIPQHDINLNGPASEIFKKSPSNPPSPLLITTIDPSITQKESNRVNSENRSSSEMVGLLSGIRETDDEEEAIINRSAGTSSVQVAVLSNVNEEIVPILAGVSPSNSNIQTPKGPGDEDVVVAMAIEDDDVDEVDEAQQYDPSSKLRLKKKMQLWTLTSFVAATSVTVLLIIFLSRKKLEALEVEPTLAPSLAPTTEANLQISLSIMDEFGRDKPYNDQSTPWGKAIDWITQDFFTLDLFDDLSNSKFLRRAREESVDTIHQRFLCGLLYYEMGGERWLNCSANAGFQNLTCSSIDRDGSLIEGSSIWLSPVDVCAWAGITCDEKGRVVFLDLSEYDFVHPTFCNVCS